MAQGKYVDIAFKRWSVLLFAVVNLATLTLPATELGAEPIWGTFEGNSRNTSYSPLNGPTIPVVRWVRTEGIMLGVASSYYRWNAPVVASDGTIYIPDLDLLALNPDSTTKWRHDSPGGALVWLSVDAEDGVYAMYRNLSPSTLIHLDKNDNGLGSVPVGGPAMLGADGSVFGSRQDLFYGVGSDGTVLWSLPTSQGNSGTVGVAPDGTVYLADRSSLHSVNPTTGEINWTFDRSSASHHHPRPTIGLDGTILTTDHQTYQAVALASDGSVKWTNDDVFYWQDDYATVMLDDSGESYWVKDEEGIYALDAEGNTRWFRSLNPRRNAALTGNGLIYITDEIGNGHTVLRAISTETGQDVWVFDAGPRIELTDVAVGGDHLIYVTGLDWNRDGDGLIYAIAPEPASIGILCMLLPVLCSRSRIRQ